jgi:hypothetical protein
MRSVLRAGLVMLFAAASLSCASRKPVAVQAPALNRPAEAGSSDTALPTGWAVTDWDTVELNLEGGGEISLPMWIARNPDQPEVVYVNFTWADRRSGWSIADPGLSRVWSPAAPTAPQGSP